tara:strand:+ start:425 stop:1060 length:636 start_codon:yes stop_codon:yes gene_type:complete
MVNIQIRGPLVHIIANRLTENEITSMIGGEKNISKIIYEKYGRKNFDNIFHQTFPILAESSEIHVSSFDNDNYYDEGHTYFRANLKSIISNKINFKIGLREPLPKNTIISVLNGYGTGFETEIIDFDYKNFSPNDIACYSSDTFWSKHKIAHGINLNYLTLGDLGRNKYQVSSITSYLINSHKNTKEISLGNELIDNTRVTKLDYFQTDKD